jgi:hypothetical protein
VGVSDTDYSNLLFTTSPSTFGMNGSQFLRPVNEVMMRAQTYFSDSSENLEETSTMHEDNPAR